MTMHPKARRSTPQLSAFDRRAFLRGSLAVSAGVAGASLLAGCGSGSTSGGTEPSGIPMARPTNPVTLPIANDNQPIGDNLPPESGGVFKILNYADYMAPSVMKQFGDAHNVQVEVTPYNNYDEMLAKLRAPNATFDVVFPGPSVLSKMVYGNLLQPLNKSYVPNIDNVWTEYQSPWYDVNAQYTVPYTIYTTGVGYRADRVDSVPANGYDLFWDPAYNGKVYLLDVKGEALGMSLLRNDITTDINTTDPDLLNQASAKLTELINLVNVKLGIQDYIYLPDGTATIHQAWSGDMIAAQYYLPKGVNVDVLAYWVPDTNRVVGNDVIAIPKGAEKPVLAHMFIDNILDNEVALKNFGWNGYQPPLTAITAQSLIKDGYIPENLMSAVVLPKDFKDGISFYEIPAAGEAVWQNAWADFKAGA
ncbi:MAG: spermidine/putrescine ABC transporter substrate-binding protein [Actinomycetes bacterium]